LRRENSAFNAAFVSHEGSRLFNNDYYGCAELDGYACYAIADGLEPGDTQSDSARLAVDAAIEAFHQKPSMKAGALKRYILAAHKALLRNSRHLRMRASITVVVTDYQAARYAWAGNSRFYLFRSGRVVTESLDHSLSRQMAQKGALSTDKIAKHLERSNLSRYLGQRGSLTPEVSKKIKLKEGDIFALLTRGVWERCDYGDLRAAIDSGENDPQLALTNLERVMLDPYPEDMDNYTAAIVFVDKAFVDPNKGKKLKRILMIAIPIFIVLVILTVVLIILHNRKAAKRQDMETAFLSAVEYIGDDNYPRASEELKTSQSLANDIKDREFAVKVDGYQKLADAILKGDELFLSGSFVEAQEAYTTARNRSIYTDNAGMDYIERKLTQNGKYINVRDLIALGDKLTASGDFDGAESKYLAARSSATGISDAEGRQQALDALESLYDKKASAEETSAAQSQQQSQKLKEAADMEADGDKAAADNDLTLAKLYYTIARDRFIDLKEPAAVTRIDQKLKGLEDAQAKLDEQAKAAVGYVYEGDWFYDQGEFVDAKVKYILARNIYAKLGLEVELAAVLSKIDLCDVKINALPTPPATPTPSLAPTPSPSPDVEEPAA
jgi:serine/threonine protein phosphatase PrpC